METYLVLKDLAIIIIAAKLFGIVARKLKAPQVVGEIIAGLIIGPSVLGLVNQSDFLAQMAEIGVILLMFSAGLETDLKELMKTGPIATLCRCFYSSYFRCSILYDFLWYVTLGFGGILQGSFCGNHPYGNVSQHYGTVSKGNG